MLMKYRMWQEMIQFNYPIRGAGRRGGDSIILQNCFPQEVRPTCIISGNFEKKVGKGLLITVKYTEILSRRWNQDSYCFLDLKV